MPENNGRTIQARLALAISMMKSNRWNDAERICKQLLTEYPELTDASYLLGVLYQTTQQVDRAIPCFEAVIRRVNNHPDALNNLGTIFELQNNTQNALECYEQAATSNPGHSMANYNFGRMLRVSGQPEDAAKYLRAALSGSPNSAHVLHELGLSLKAQGKLEEALTHLQHARTYLPEDPAIRIVIGNVFQLQGQIENAIHSYMEAIQLKSDFASAFNNLGSALVARGDVSTALENYQTAIMLQPDWAGAASNVLLAENYISDNSERLYQKHCHYGAILQNRIEKHMPEHARKADQKIRIGYVSPDFRFHSVAHFLKTLLSNHDHSKFEITCFSDVASPDGMTQEFESLASDWQNIHGLSDTEVFQRIRDCRIDILVDLAGHTANNRLPVFAMQAAPVQVSYLGYPSTTGLESIQYRITDHWADPPGKADSQHTERLIRLPECFLCYTPPAECPEITGLPADTNGFVTYGSFNVLAKISDRCIEAWSAILRQSPDSKLLLKSAGLQDLATRDYIHHRFSSHGVAPDRVNLIARTADFQSHMNSYNRIDISLDTFPYNGTTTTCESLWMGVPVVTLAGTRHAARVGASLLHQVSLDEYVSDTITEYISTARLLAENLDTLRGLRKQLRTTMASSPLCDCVRHTSGIEFEYEKMHASHSQKLHAPSGGN